MAVLMSKQIVLPNLGKRLSDYAHGDIVKLNENGTPVEFYVAKHDYESGLNGTGRTLLVRKDCYDRRGWDSNEKNNFRTSTIATWLNSSYKALLDTSVQNAIGTTNFYVARGWTSNEGTTGQDNVITATMSVFMLSVTELGKSADKAAIEGSPLPITGFLIPVYRNGSKTRQWTRTGSVGQTGNNAAFCLDVNGNPSAYSSMISNGVYGGDSRPCFTLPSKALFNPDTNEFVEVR